MVAGRGSRAGRAELGAACAARPAGARMGAEPLVQRDITRLVEFADELGCREGEALDRGGIARVGAQIAGAQVSCGEERGAAADVDDDVAMRDRAVARGFEDQLRPGGRGGRGIVVDAELEGTEPAGRASDRALEHREIVEPRRCDLARPRQQHGDVEMLGEALRQRDRAVVAAIDQRHALAGEGGECGRRQRLARGREQRRHFRAGGFRLPRPARGFPDVGEDEVAGVVEIGRHFLEQWRFLGTGDGDRLALGEHLLEAFDLAAAKMAVLADVRALAAALQGGAVERHRVLARADHQRACDFGHRGRIPRKLASASFVALAIIHAYMELERLQRSKSASHGSQGCGRDGGRGG